MMIVVSSSMEPLYYRGDIVVLLGTGPEGIEGPVVEIDRPLSQTAFSEFASPAYKPGTRQIESIEFNSGQAIPITKEGSIVVYWSDLMNEPIIHRVAAKLHAEDGWFLLTKGDSINNSTIDQDCGLVENGIPEKPCIELYPVPIKKLQGKSILHVPLLGCGKLWLLDDLASLITTGKLPKEWEQHNIC